MIPNHPLNLGPFNAALIHVRHRHAGPPTPQHTSQCRYCIHFSRSNNDAVDRTRSTSGLALLDHKSLFYSYCNLVQLHLLWDKHQHWVRKIGFNFPHLLIWSIKCNWNSQPFRSVSLLPHTCIVHIFTSTRWICAAAKKEKRCISQILPQNMNGRYFGRCARSKPYLMWWVLYFMLKEIDCVAWTPIHSLTFIRDSL